MVIVPTPSGELGTLNVKQDDARWPVPIVLAGSRMKRLERAAGVPASLLLIDGEYKKMSKRTK